MSDKLMADFEEFEGLTETYVDSKDDDLDNMIGVPHAQKQDVKNLNPSEISDEFIKRHRKIPQFTTDQMKVLQEIFEEEFKQEEANLRKERFELRKKQAKQAGLQKRRLDMETKLQEEIDELTSNFQINSVIECIKTNQKIPMSRIDVNNISSRSLAKALWLNSLIICIDLTCNYLDDNAGCYIARILRRNATIKKMEVDNNHFGVKTIKAFAESISMNSSLEYLSIGSNPLTGPVEQPDKFIADTSGVAEFAQAMATNTSIRFLNLWRSNLGQDGGKFLAKNLEMNDTILFCEVGHNSIHLTDAQMIAKKLDNNLAAYNAHERHRRDEIMTQAERDKILQDELEAKQAAAELDDELKTKRASRLRAIIEEEEKKLERGRKLFADSAIKTARHKAEKEKATQDKIEADKRKEKAKAAKKK